VNSILVESFLQTGPKEYDLKSFRILCSSYYFNSGINSQRVTELREEVIYALRQLALTLFESYKKHTLLLNTTPLLNYTKLGLLCFITGSLQNHLDNIDSFFSQLQTMMKNHGIYDTDPNFLSLPELTQFIQESQLVFRAMKHVESIVIKEKSFQRDQNLAVQYYIEKFVLSTNTKATMASVAHYYRASASHKYYYCLPKEFIVLNLSMDSTRKNLFSSFQVYQGKYVKESINEKQPVKKIIPYFHQVVKELNFLMKSVEEERKINNSNRAEKSMSQKTAPRSVKSSPVVSSRTVTEKNALIGSSHRQVGGFKSCAPKGPPRSSITSINRSLGFNPTSSNSANIKEFLLYDYFPFYFLMCGRTILAKTLLSKLQEILGQKLFHKLEESQEFFKQLLEYLSLLLFYSVWALEDIEKNNNDKSYKLADAVDSKLPTLGDRFLNLAEFSLVNYELSTSDRAYQKKQMTQLLRKYYSVRRKWNAFAWKTACDFIYLDSEEFLSNLPDFLQQF
jgi:hypothetical protein